MNNETEIFKDNMNKAVSSLVNIIVNNTAYCTISNFSSEGLSATNVVKIKVPHELIKKDQDSNSNYALLVYDILSTPENLSRKDYFNWVYEKHPNFKKLVDSNVSDKNLVGNDCVLVDITRTDTDIIVSVQYGN